MKRDILISLLVLFVLFLYHLKLEPYGERILFLM